VFWVISVYFNIRNTLPKSGTFLLGHPVYIMNECILKQRGSAQGLQCVNASDFHANAGDENPGKIYAYSANMLEQEVM